MLNQVADAGWRTVQGCCEGRVTMTSRHRSHHAGAGRSLADSIAMITQARLPCVLTFSAESTEKLHEIYRSSDWLGHAIDRGRHHGGTSEPRSHHRLADQVGETQH